MGVGGFGHGDIVNISDCEVLVDPPTCKLFFMLLAPRDVAPYSTPSLHMTDSISLHVDVYDMTFHIGAFRALPCTAQCSRLHLRVLLA